MAQLSEAIARYHKLLETPSYRDLSWAEALQEQMRNHQLTEAGRLVSPILRPHFVSVPQHEALTKAANGIMTLLERIQGFALEDPQLMARLHLLPAEKMLARIPTGYGGLSVSARLDGHSADAIIFNGLKPRTPSTVPYSEALADLFLGLPLVKDFKGDRYKLVKLNSGKQLIQAVARTWKEFRGYGQPRAAIVEFRQQFSGDSNESHLLAEVFSTHGIPTEVVTPEQLRYQGSVLRSGDCPIDMVFRRFRTQELLLRYDLAHPLLTAYRDGTVCVINSFRSELAERRSLFALLTDERVTGDWPVSERSLIQDHVAWTRVVTQSKTTRHDAQVDLPEFIVKNRELLVLLPNDDSTEQPSFYGSELTQPAWERAVNTALRSPYVVQDALPAASQVFPVYNYGELQMKSLHVTIHPHQVLGLCQGLSATLSQTAQTALVPVARTPALLLEES